MWGFRGMLELQRCAGTYGLIKVCVCVCAGIPVDGEYIGRKTFHRPSAQKIPGRVFDRAIWHRLARECRV